MNDTLGKKAEAKIKEWLDRPSEGYCLDRIPDQMTGLCGSKNICDFTLFKSPYMYYIESKSTWDDRFDFNQIRGIDDPKDIKSQYGGLLHKSSIDNVYGVIIVLFASHKRAFILNIVDIDDLVKSGKKSLNIKKIDKWGVPIREIETIPNNRKHLLDYTGDIVKYTKGVNQHEEVC